MYPELTYDKLAEHFENEKSGTGRNLLKPFEDYLNLTSTKPKQPPVFQDETCSTTSLNIYDELLIENPLLEIESQIIDAVSIDNGDDMYNDQYRNSFYKIIARYDALAIMVVSDLIDSQRIKFLQAIELLSFLGKIRHLPTYHHRTWLLVKNLSAVSKYVRDGASLGLLYLENPLTINPLKNAIEKEPSKQLRSNMIQVLNGLERKLNAVSTAKNTCQ